MRFFLHLSIHVFFFSNFSSEFVKNLQQIYKYNCTQKDDLIKKGLGK